MIGGTTLMENGNIFTKAEFDKLLLNICLQQHNERVYVFGRYGNSFFLSRGFSVFCNSFLALDSLKTMSTNLSNVTVIDFIAKRIITDSQAVLDLCQKNDKLNKNVELILDESNNTLEKCVNNFIGIFTIL